MMDGNNFSDLFGRFGSMIGKPSLGLISEARKGDLRAVKNYCRQHQSCGHLVKDKSDLLDEMLNAPREFVRPAQLMDTIARGFDFGEYFTVDERGRAVWSLYAKNPGPDSAKLGGIIAAEYLRAKILQDEKFTFDFAALFKPEKGMTSLSTISGNISMRDSFVIVQNALVDYMVEEGASVVLNRGVGMLSYLQNDVSQDVSSLWTKKISGFVERSSKHGLLRANVVHITPTYEV